MRLPPATVTMLSMLVLIASCTTSKTRPASTPTPLPRTHTSHNDVAHSPALRAEVSGPARVPYDPLSLGPSGRFVKIHMTNAGTESVRIKPLRVGFSAARDGVTFPCPERPDDIPTGSEPSWLAPGDSFVFERPLACRLPLPGHYEVNVLMRLGASAQGQSKSVGTFGMDVDGGPQGPRTHPSRKGLFAIMTGGRSTRPLSAEAWARGEYSVFLAVINGGAHEVVVGSGRLSFLVYKTGSPLPCSGAAEQLVLPAALQPGAMHIVRTPIACAPTEQGEYEIIGLLTLGQASDEMEVGRIGLKVTNDPMLYAPVPVPNLYDHPSGSIK